MNLRCLLRSSPLLILATWIMAASACADDGAKSPARIGDAPYDALCLLYGTPVPRGTKVDGLSWRVMGPRDGAPFDRQGVCLEQFPSIGSPVLRSSYLVRDADDSPLGLAQGVKGYLAEIPSEPERVQVNGIAVEVRGFADYSVGVFLTGETSFGGEIWGQVIAPSRGTLLEFIATLEFTDTP